MQRNLNDPPPERHRLARASRAFRGLRGKPVLPKRKIEDIPPYERLPSRLPKRTLPRPADPKEAKRWLRELADYLSTDPNASGRFRFIAYAIKRFLRGKNRLSEALCLTTEKNTKPGRPTTPPETVTHVLSMLRQNIPVSSIAKAAGVSRDTVETIRAAKNKTYPAIRDTDRTEDGDVRKAQWEEALERADSVPKELRDAIIAESAASIDLSDWREETQSKILPNHRPVIRKRKPNPASRQSK